MRQRRLQPGQAEDELPALAPVDESGVYRGRLRLAQRHGGRDGGAPDLREPASRKATSTRPESIQHVYPHCWRCKTELIFRLVDEWFISMRELRDEIMRCHAGDPLDPRLRPGPRDGLAAQHGRLDDLQEALLGSGAADLRLRRRATTSRSSAARRSCKSALSRAGTSSRATRRIARGWTRSKIRCAHAARWSAASPTWAIPGSTPASCPTRRCATATTVTYWREWFPADFITESFPGQFRNWFYSMLVMSAALEDTEPFKTVLGFATALDQDGEGMHKSLGNSIPFDEAADDRRARTRCAGSSRRMRRRTTCASRACRSRSEC